jgi:hypothetical protein
MKVKVHNVQFGMLSVRTIGELLDYAEELTIQYGRDAEYECSGHDTEEYVVTYRDETKAEKKIHEAKANAYTILRGNSCKDTHNQVISEIGYYNYMTVINDLNKEKTNER